MLPDHYDLKDVLHATVNSRVCLVERDGQEYVAKLPPIGHEKAAKRFAREIGALQNAAGRHTIPIIDFADDYSWYVMPRAAGDLNTLTVPTDSETVLAVLTAMAESLRPLHAVGEVHRDLKPGNVLWLPDTGDERWVVADFGIVRNPLGATTSDLTVTGVFLGTDGWAAPEQGIDAHDVTPAADVYAAGLIAAWMVTGKHPREGAVSSLTTAPMANAILRATSERAARRYQSIDDLVVACRKELSSNSPSVASLLSEHLYAEILPTRFVDPDLREESLEDLASMSSDSRTRWFSMDPIGVVEVLATAIEGLVDDHQMISFNATVDPILVHGVEVLHSLARSGDPATRRFAVTIYGGIADIHQFAPAERALDRMDSLPATMQQVLREALHESGAWDFFSQMATRRFPSKRKSPLVIDLSKS